MNIEMNVAGVAGLIGDPTCAAMLEALLDGRALPANELGYAAGRISAQAASPRLAKLVAGGLLAVEQQGRHRYFRLASPQIVQTIEALTALVPLAPSLRRLSPQATRLHHARSCYDHLAGEAGTAIMQALIARRLMLVDDDGWVEVTPAGSAWFADLGIDVHRPTSGRHGIARACLDWTERRHHLAGPLGARLLLRLAELCWLRRESGSRAIRFTPTGYRELKSRLGITLAPQE